MLFQFIKKMTQEIIKTTILHHSYLYAVRSLKITIDDFLTDNNSSASFKFKTKIAGKTENDGTQNVKIRIPLKYLSNFRRTLEMSLINCEINLILTWPNRCFK